MITRPKSHLRTNSRHTEFTKNEAGEIIDSNTKEHKYLADNKEQFFLGYVSLLAIFYEKLSGPEIKVYAYLLAHYSFESTIGIIRGLKEEMSSKIGIKLPTINNALSGLLEAKLLYTISRGTYKLNPRYAFKGSTGDRNRMLKVILQLECPDC
jgi:hypothetical protein